MLKYFEYTGLDFMKVVLSFFTFKKVTIRICKSIRDSIYDLYYVS